jgi:hypothetical protein
MDFKLVSKNNVGTVVLLLLVIALSQAKAFNFLIDSALGRFFLIVFILCLSHCHKILGVVGVLFVIIMFNGNMYYEGFGNISTDASGNSTSTDSSGNSISTDASGNPTSSLNSDQIKQMIQQQIQQKMSSNDNTTTSTTDTTETTKKSKNSKNTAAAEGFDILGIENNIKRGKQSNSIPVNNLMRDSDSISPYEGTSFLGSFSPF